MDEYSYYSSQTEQRNEFLFSNVQTNYCVDSNNGSYPNGQVTFDLSMEGPRLYRPLYILYNGYRA